MSPPRPSRTASSARLLGAFRFERSDPDRFYRLLAQDTAALVGDYAPLRGRRVLEVGSGPGDLSEAMRAAGARAVALDPDWSELHCRERTLEAAVVGDGARLPFPDAAFDVGCCSNVLEHVADPYGLVEELGRVVRPGGVLFVNYTTWLSPFGGHETAPWHYLGGRYAARRYERRHGAAPKNRYGSTLFALGVGPVLGRVERLADLELLDAFPRYFPRWTRPIVKVPGLREVATWNLALVLRRR